MFTIAKTEGIEVSDTVPDSVPPGGDQDLDHHIVFNDLEIVGGLPSSLNVVGISKIEIYNVQDAEQGNHVVGIQTIYKLDGGTLSPPVVHGRKTQHLTTIGVDSEQRIIAAFVGVTEGDSTKKIQALRFTTTNLKTGAVETKGYAPTSPTAYTYSAAFGDVVAFQGSKLRGAEGISHREVNHVEC
ncbi:hypothetical protein V8E55_005330 [Tylopilus felleus]